MAMAMVALAVIFAILAILYAVGALQLFTSTGTGRHKTHAILFGVLAIASLVGANFARQKSTI